MPALPCLHDVVIDEPRPGAVLRERTEHTWHELVYVRNGSYRGETTTGSLTLQAGDYIVYPAGLPHQGLADRTGGVVLIILQWYDESRSPADEAFAQSDRDGRLLQALYWLMDLNHEAADRDEQIAHLLVAVVAEVARQGEAGAGVDPLERCRHYLHANLHDHVSRDELAHIAGLNPMYFSRAFKARFDESPMRYLQRIRVEAAISRIRTTDQAMEEIARACGIQSASHLSRLVRRYTGRSPREFR